MYGYDSDDDVDDPAFGTLSDTSFEYGGNVYVVEFLYEYGQGTDLMHSALIDLDGTLPTADRDRLRLHLCDESFDLAATTYNSTLNSYTWNQTAPLDWSNAMTVLAALSVEYTGSPEFDEGDETERFLPENTPPGVDIGAPVRALPEFGYRLMYRLYPDSDGHYQSFDIDADTGQLRTRAGVDYDFETQDLYLLDLEAVDSRGGLVGEIIVRVRITDVAERPLAPDRPLVASAGNTSLSVTWTEPAIGDSALAGYDLRHRQEGTATWTDVTDLDAADGTSAPVAQLTADTAYEVQVRAFDFNFLYGPWSASGFGSTGSGASGKPEISGLPQSGQTLTASRDAVTDLDGTTKADAGESGYAYAYQWIRDGSDISGATSSTYTLSASDEGSYVRVRVSFTDDADNAESATSDAVGPVAELGGGVCLSSAHWCTTLTVGAGAEEAGTSYGYRGDGPPHARYGSLGVDVIAYGGLSFRVESLTYEGADGTVTLVTSGGRVPHESVFNLGGTEFTADAAAEHGDAGYRWVAPSDVVWFEGQRMEVGVRLGNFPATGKPAITGTTHVGSELTANTSGIADPDGKTQADDEDDYDFVWYRLQEDETIRAIVGAAARTYTLAAADKDRKIRVEVRFVDDLSHTEGPLYSNFFPPRFQGVRDASEADATLSGLEVHDNEDNLVALSATFDPEHIPYIAIVAHSVDWITVSAYPNAAGATYEFQDEDGNALDDARAASGFQLDLAPGDNFVAVVVTAKDLITTETYELWVSRALPAPRVAPTAGSATSLDVSWDTGAGTAYLLYYLRYRVVGGTNFTNGPEDLTGTAAVIAGLTESTDYEVQVLVNSEDTGFGLWSAGGIGLTHAAEATVRGSWSLRPSALAAGAKFRLLYVSHNAVSNEHGIGYYNDRVREYAAGENGGVGHADIQTYAPGFRAVGCDAQMNARVNTGTQWSSSERGVVIFWLGGIRVAHDYGEFYSGGWQNEGQPRTEAGEIKPGSDRRVNVGCDPDGSADSQGRVLGAATVRLGDLVGTVGPLASSSTDSAGASYPVYGLSQVFVVPDDLVEPRVASIVRRDPLTSPTRVDRLTWRVEFSEDVEKVDAADFALAGTTATVTVVAVTARAYNVIASDGDLAGLTATVTLSFASDQDIEDAAGNLLTNTAPTGANQNTYVVDNDPPTVTISVPDTSTAAFTATFTFSEPVTGFDVGDIDVGNGMADNFAGSGDTYTATITPTANGDVTVDVAADAATDGAGNGNTVAVQAKSTYTATETDASDATLSGLEVLDNGGNTLVLSPAFAPGTTDYTAVVANGVDWITVDPSPNVAGATYEFQDGEGTALDDADTADGFQVDLVPGDNVVAVVVTATDTTTMGTYTLTVSRALGAPRVAPTEGSTTSLDASWSAAAGAGVTYDLRYSVDGGTTFTDGPQDLTGTSEVIAGLMASTDYEVQVRATSDAVVGEWSPVGYGLTHAPEVTVAADWSLLPAGLAADTKFRLLYVSHNSRWGGSQINRYNDWVREYAAGQNSGRGHEDIRAYAPGFRAVGCDAQVNARVNTGTQWTTSERGARVYWLDGPIAADDYGDFYDGTWQNEDESRTEAGVPKSSNAVLVLTGCKDNGDPSGAGNVFGSSHVELGRLNGAGGPLNAATIRLGTDSGPIYGLSQVFVVPPDDGAPRVASIERHDPMASPTNEDELTWQVTFSEDVDNVDAADFALAGTTATVEVVDVTAKAYNVTASSGDLAGLTATVTLSFATGQDIEDAADNALANTMPTGANENTYYVDNTPPTVTIGVPETSTGRFQATFEFSDPVSGFVLGDIDVGNGTASNFAGSGRSYTADITPTANGDVTVDVAADAATDAANNGNTAAARATSIYTATGNEQQPDVRRRHAHDAPRAGGRGAGYGDRRAGGGERRRRRQADVHARRDGPDLVRHRLRDRPAEDLGGARLTRRSRATRCG